MTQEQHTESSELERGESQQGNGNISYGSTNHHNSKNESEGERQSFLTASSSPTNVGSDNYKSNDDNDNDSSSNFSFRRHKLMTRYLDALTKIPLRRVALEVSLYVNLIITLIKLLAYIQTLSLSVLAALLDSVLDVVSQVVLNYTEKHSSLQRSSAFYPAGASRLEPIGVLTCAALMGMGSFEVLKQSVVALITLDNPFHHDDTTGLSMTSFWSMTAIVIVKILLLLLCQRAAEDNGTVSGNCDDENGGYGFGEDAQSQVMIVSNAGSSRAVVQLADPTLEALAQDHWNDALSNAVAAAALFAALQSSNLWFLDPIGAIIISIYIIWSWYHTGKEQIEQLTGKSAPGDFIEELLEIANNFDERMLVDVCRAYHFGPKFLVELEVVLPKNTLLFQSHDLGMELQYEIESRPEVERCFVHIDYEQRPYDEHVVSKVPELREKYRPGRDAKRWRSSQSL